MTRTDERADGDPGRERLLRVIRRVRTRWRLRTLLRGTAVVGGVALAAFLATAYGLERLRFAPEAVVAFRIGTYVLLFALAWMHLVRPLLRRIDDARVALYLEEHEPSLEAAVLTAVDPAGPGTTSLERSGGDAGPGAADDPLLERLAEEALERCRRIEYGRRVDRGLLHRYSGILAGVGVLGVFLFALGPDSLRTGASALLFPTRDAGELNPYSLSVRPGDETVARGSDLVVTARPVGFETGEAELVTVGARGEVLEATPMFPSDDGTLEQVLVDLDEPVRYFVRASGVRSPTYTVDVAELPYVDDLELEYRFPAYTGLEPRTVEDGGDIAVLPGTRVVFRVTSTVPTRAGRLVLDDSTTGELRPDSSGRLVGELVVRDRGGYRIELERPDGRMGAASPHYTIDLLSDRAPTVRFEKPGRDSRASPIDEVFVQVRAEDDHGVASVDLVYSVNGGAEDTVAILRGDRGGPDVSAGHTFFLEEWELVPGDVVSYYAVARDAARPGGSREAVTDIYFVGIRPFSRDYSQAEQSGGGGGGGEGPDGGALVEVQRQIVAATFNLLRERDGYPEDEWRSDVVSVALSQKRLLDQVSTLLERIRTRVGGVDDEAFRTVVEELPRAVEAMEEASGRLDDREVRAALAPEQRALLHLQRADEAYREVRVSLDNDGGGGGGGGSTPQAEDLADLFELELDKLSNQYETVQRERNRQADQELDETRERLRELARRQQQEVERRERRLQGVPGTPGDAERQRALAEETEEAARRLERLARERGSRELEETARRLQEAAEAMRRSAAGDAGGTGSARGAAERLEEARRRLEEQRSARLRSEVERSLERARGLRDRQERMRRDVADLEDSANRVEGRRRLAERKEEMADEVADLERQLDRAAARARQDGQRETARALGDAAEEIRQERLEDRIRYSRGLLDTPGTERTRAFEERIAEDLESVTGRLTDAEELARTAEREGSSLEEALEEARSLARGVETMERRLREGTDGGGDAAAPGRSDSSAEGPPGEGAASVDPETARQLRREAAERIRDARGLRQRLREEGRSTEDLDRAIERLRQLDAGRVYDDPEEVLRLQRAAAASLDDLEFALQREIEGGDRPAVRVPGRDVVPEEYREQVEEYYRALSEGREPGG